MTVGNHIPSARGLGHSDWLIESPVTAIFDSELHSSSDFCLISISALAMNPPDHFQLSETKFVTLSIYANKLRIHIRDYVRKEDGNLIPTRKGVTLPPFIWMCLQDEITYMEQPSYNGSIHHIENALMISSALQGDADPLIVLQRYFQHSDFRREFFPTAAVLTYAEWKSLRQQAEKITPHIIPIRFGKVLPQVILAEARKRSPDPTSVLQEDAEMILSTSIVELLADYIAEAINLVFKCSGCETEQGNQLAHPCTTYDFDMKLRRFGDKALAKIDFDQFSRDFVEKNSQFVNYISEELLAKWDFTAILQAAKDMFVKRDSDPFSFYNY